MPGSQDVMLGVTMSCVQMSVPRAMSCVQMSVPRAVSCADECA